MLTITRTPSWPLSQFISTVWLFDHYVKPYRKERLLPDGSMAIVFNLKESVSRIYDRHDITQFTKLNGNVLMGPQSECFVIDTHEQAHVAGIHFKPGGAAPFFDLPLDELHGKLLNLDDAWGADAASLRCDLLSASSPDEKFETFERHLMRRAKNRMERHPAVRYALAAFDGNDVNQSVARVVDQIGLSAKRFIQVFREDVGLTPKVFCRVQRFQRVLRAVNKGHDVDWADVAVSCGYFDQAHFIRDFREFSGINPSTYLACRRDNTSHVPILDA